MPSTMRPSSKGTVATLFVLTLVILGSAELWVVRQKLAATTAGDVPSDTTPTMVMPAQSPDVAAFFATQADVTLRPTDEPTLLATVTTTPGDAQAILHDSEYAGVITWITSPDVRAIFLSMKEALLPAFSADVTGLRDTTRQDPGHPVRNILTFRDPAFGPDTFVLLRVRDRLYEFHIATGKEAVLEKIIEELTTQ